MLDPIEQAARHLALQPAIAESEARSLLARMPGDPRASLILASALRRQGKADQAMPLLSDLAQRWPRAARTRYELGMCLAATGQRAQGMAALALATRLDPAHTEAWEALAEAAFAAGDTAQEAQAQAALSKMKLRNKALAPVLDLIAGGRTQKAEAVLRRHLQSHPHDTEAAVLLANRYIERRAFEHAETLLRHALTIEPALAIARFDLARSLFARQQAHASLTELAPLLAQDAGNPAYRNLAAGCRALLGDDIGAEALHGGLARQYPGNPRIALNHGHALRTMGRRDEAIAAYRHAAALAPQAGEAWWSIANLKTGALGEADKQAMTQALAAPGLGDDDRLHLHYALGKLSEDLSCVEAAFDHYAAGARLMRARLHHDADEADRQAAAKRIVFGADALARPHTCATSHAPIFIVGLPRSGSTLVEQILASHVQVEGTMELPHIPNLAARLEREPGGMEALLDMSAQQLEALGADYLAACTPHRHLGRPRFIDKMPNNFQHIGLIRLILPQARIIDVRRHPMAACFSAFKQLFAEGQEFSYDLGELGRYYRRYLATIRHYASVTPGAVHTLIYEDLVTDTEAQVRGLLDACALPFDAACLAFYENPRSVRTVSSEQVRQPIYRSGIDHWQIFAPHLADLARSLGDNVSDWRR